MSDAGGSVWHLLGVWLLIGSSFMRLGSGLAESVRLPVTDLGAGLLFGTVVVAVGWTVGLRPSLPASLAYFLLEQLFALAVALVTVSVAVWPQPATTAASISIAGSIVFGGVTKLFVERARPVVRRLLRVPRQPER